MLFEFAFAEDDQGLLNSSGIVGFEQSLVKIIDTFSPAAPFAEWPIFPQRNQALAHLEAQFNRLFRRTHALGKCHA